MNSIIKDRKDRFRLKGETDYYKKLVFNKVQQKRFHPKRFMVDN